MTGEFPNLQVEILVSVFLLLGSAFVLTGAIDLYRLPDFFMCLHGPTKATTLGVGEVIVTSLIYLFDRQVGVGLHELLVSLFLFISAPVGAYMLAKAAVPQQSSLEKKTRGGPWERWGTAQQFCPLSVPAGAASQLSILGVLFPTLRRCPWWRFP